MGEPPTGGNAELARETIALARSSFGVLLMFDNMSLEFDGLSTVGGVFSGARDGPDQRGVHGHDG